MTATADTMDMTACRKAVLAAPDDDLPRLLLADAADEQAGGLSPLGEFVRLQVELARLTDGWKTENLLCLDMYLDPQDGEQQTWKHKVQALQARVAELEKAHRAAWLRGPACPDCAYDGCRQWGQQCPTCRGTNDAGGLTWPMPDPAYLVDSPHNTRRPPEVEFRRGFPWKVTVPRLADAVAVPEYYTADDPEPVGTPRATPWLAAVCRHHPVEQVVCLDQTPWVALNRPHSRNQYGWWRINPALPFPDDDEGGEVTGAVFDLMWAEWKASRIEDADHKWLLWDVRQDAVDALAEAIVTFGRGTP